jgi:hypothetical protein
MADSMRTAGVEICRAVAQAVGMHVLVVGVSGVMGEPRSSSSRC